jgi:P27 family predicted phage terminase small subunit
MTKRGPKTTPTALKEQNGNPGHRPLNKNEPQFDPALPSAPEFLTDAAKAEWKRVAPQLFASRVLTEADRSALAGYCQAYADWVHAREMLDGGFTIITEKGNVIQSPWVGIANKALGNYLKIAAEFGMTPSSRSALSAIAPKKNSKLDKFREKKS